MPIGDPVTPTETIQNDLRAWLDDLRAMVEALRRAERESGTWAYGHQVTRAVRSLDALAFLVAPEVPVPTDKEDEYLRAASLAEYLRGILARADGPLGTEEVTRAAVPFRPLLDRLDARVKALAEALTLV